MLGQVWTSIIGSITTLISLRKVKQTSIVHLRGKVYLTNNSKSIGSIWINIWRCLKPKFTRRVTYSNLVVVFCVVLKDKKLESVNIIPYRNQINRSYITITIILISSQHLQFAFWKKKKRTIVFLTWEFQSTDNWKVAKNI